MSKVHKIAFVLENSRWLLNCTKMHLTLPEFNTADRTMVLPQTSQLLSREEKGEQRSGIGRKKRKESTGYVEEGEGK